MRVLILGGGTVGSSVAKRLCEQKHDVTVVDCCSEVVASLDESLDARVLQGDVSRASYLFQAGASSADVCLALTGGDETNLLAGSIVKAMGTRRVASRVFVQEYCEVAAFDYRRHFNIDRLLSLEYLTAMELARRIREPGAMLIEHFASGELEMQDVAITRESNLTDKPLKDVSFPSDVRIGAINRDGEIRIATAFDEIKVGDRVTLLGSRPHVESVKKSLLIGSVTKRNVEIVGGGETGLFVATVLERRNYNVKVFERDRDRCEFLAKRLPKSTIVHGDGRRRKVLEEQRLHEKDVFVACTGDDEYNIIACVEALELGVENLMAVVKHQDYAGIVGKLGIHEVVSPFEMVGRQVEGLMHSGPLVFQNSTLLSGPIEVVELEVGESSRMTSAPLRDLGVPRPTLIAAVIRENTVMIPNASFVFRPYDTIVAFTLAEKIPQLVELFE